VPVILLTRRVQEKHMNAAMAQIEGARPPVEGKVTRIRLEHLSSK